MNRYFVIDGPDGCGKSTQAKALVTHLRTKDQDVVHLREPGSTALAERIRNLLLEPDTEAPLPITEALLFTAARAELVQRQIAPALAAGQVVVVERCYLSTLVYQGYAPLAARRVPLQMLRNLAGFVHGALWPARIFVLECRPEESAARRAGRTTDRFEQQDGTFQRRIHEGFRVIGSEDPSVEFLDGSAPFDEVQRHLRARVMLLLQGLSKPT